MNSVIEQMKNAARKDFAFTDGSVDSGARFMMALWTIRDGQPVRACTDVQYCGEVYPEDWMADELFREMEIARNLKTPWAIFQIRKTAGPASEPVYLIATCETGNLE